MGLNRKTPRLVVYGPMSLGGLEVMDLRLEQIIHQWETTKGHMCREDRVGTGLMLTLHDHQCIIGSNTLFLNTDPRRYKYGVMNTRWKYMWERLWDYQLKVEFYDAWIPKGNATNDENIMDKASRDPILLSSKWPMLEHVNICRLYLQAFFISDLSLNGITVDEGFLDVSKRRVHPVLNIPEIKKPTKSQWRVWKALSTEIS